MHRRRKKLNTDIFEEIKSKLDIVEVAEFYGLELNRHGKACCPFHDEKTPSFHIYPKTQSFYCFGCNVGGDIIAFVQKILNLSSPIQAAERLNDDFRLGLSMKLHKVTRAEITATAERKHKKIVVDAWQDWKDNTLKNSIRYVKMLEDWQKWYAPKSINEEFNPLFIESCQQLEYWNYLVDLMLTADENVWQKIYLEIKAGKKVE